MNVRLSVWRDNLLGSFWFVPALMTLTAALLALALNALDERVALANIPWLAWTYAGGPEGARAVLSTIGGGMLAVAGTVFSITIAALSLASGQMGPRLLRNFTRDRGNQVTLGAFIATFTYCLLVLRTVRGLTDSTFVPHLAVSFALLLALFDLGMLIYFIHHIAGAINVTHVIALVSRDLEQTLEERLQPADPGEAWRAAPDLPPGFGARAGVVRAHRGGYLQAVDTDTLLRGAAEQGAFVQLLVRPGEFVFEGMPVARSLPAWRGDLEGALVLGGERTTQQDIEYAVRQIVEVAVRALSPGINDPFTAINCLDRLGNALCQLSGRQLPSPYHYAGGELHLIVPTPDFGGVVDGMFNQIRQNGAGHPAVLIRLLEVLNVVAGCLSGQERLGALRKHAELTLEAGRRGDWQPGDLADLERRGRAFHEGLAKRDRMTQGA